MFRLEAPIIVIATREAEAALGPCLRVAGTAAFREIALAAKGLEIAYLQFRFGGHILAVSSRVRRSGATEIEIGLGDPRLPASTITADELRAALARVRRGMPSSRQQRRA